jgi:hypothetical protein
MYVHIQTVHDPTKQKSLFRRNVFLSVIYFFSFIICTVHIVWFIDSSSPKFSLLSVPYLWAFVHLLFFPVRLNSFSVYLVSSSVCLPAFSVCLSPFRISMSAFFLCLHYITTLFSMIGYSLAMSWFVPSRINLSMSGESGIHIYRTCLFNLCMLSYAIARYIVYSRKSLFLYVPRVHKWNSWTTLADGFLTDANKSRFSGDLICEIRKQICKSWFLKQQRLEGKQ